MNLYKISTENCGHFYVVAPDPSVAENNLEALLRQADNKYEEPDRTINNIQILSRQLDSCELSIKPNTRLIIAKDYV